LRDLAGSVKPGAYRPDRDVKCRCDFLVAEVGERVEEQGIPLTRAHRGESCCESSVKSRAVGPRDRLILVRDPPVDAAAAISAQLTMFGPPTSTEQVRGDPEKPGKRTVAWAEGRAPLERERERLGGKLISKTAPNPAMEVPMHSSEVAMKDQLEGLRLRQREREAVRI
jgi:hypothetical protein